jgi:hypothetical protein
MSLSIGELLDLPNGLRVEAPSARDHALVGPDDIERERRSSGA